MHRPLIHEILPFDIFTEIFYRCCESDIPYASHKLELVCKQWRIMVLNMPILWSKMTLEVGQKGKLFSDIHEGAIKWLDRSEGAPFELTVGSRFHDAGLVLFPTFLPLLRTRLEYLEIYATNTMIETLCQLPLDTIEFPLLKTLKIKALYDTRGTHSSISLDSAGRAFSRCPSLKSLRLDCSNEFGFLNQWEQLFPWSQLTSLSLEEAMPMNDILGILAACTNLVTCDISHTWHGDRSRIYPTPQRYPHLKRLSLRNDDDLEYFFRFWSRLPSLESLTTDSGFEHRSPGLPLLTHLRDISRAEQFPLRELNIYGYISETTVFLKFLRHVPTLESLTLRYTSLLDDPSFIESITIDDTNNNNLIPRLASFNAQEVEVGSLEIMYRFLYTRRKSKKCSPLQQVVVDGYWSSVEDVALEKIKILANEGLHIELPWIFAPAGPTKTVSTEEEEEEGGGEGKGKGEEGFMLDSLF